MDCCSHSSSCYLHFFCTNLIMLRPSQTIAQKKLVRKFTSQRPFPGGSNLLWDIYLLLTAARLGCRLAFPGKIQHLAALADTNGIPGLKLAGQQEFGNFVLHQPLDSAFKRPGTVLEIRTGLHEFTPGRRTYLQGNILFCQP